MKAVHFGAGNIGRGFVGLLLHDAGYEVVFADVNGALIDELAASDHYTVHEVGRGARDRVVDGYRAVNSATDAAALADELATADVVTTAVGPASSSSSPRMWSRHCGPVRRSPAARGHGVRERDQRHRPAARRDGGTAGPEEWPTLAASAVFANTAVDRIVPAQAAERDSTSPSRHSSSGRSNARRSATRPR